MAVFLRFYASPLSYGGDEDFMFATYHGHIVFFHSEGRASPSSPSQRRGGSLSPQSEGVAVSKGPFGAGRSPQDR